MRQPRFQQNTDVCLCFICPTMFFMVVRTTYKLRHQSHTKRENLSPVSLLSTKKTRLPQEHSPDDVRRRINPVVDPSHEHRGGAPHLRRSRCRKTGFHNPAFSSFLVLTKVLTLRICTPWRQEFPAVALFHHIHCSHPSVKTQLRCQTVTIIKQKVQFTLLAGE